MEVNNYFAVIVMILLASCSTEVEEPTVEKDIDTTTVVREVIVEELQVLVDSTGLMGGILIFNPDSATYYSNDFEWGRKGHLPASTYKIPNSIIALETGVVESDSSLFKWDGEPRRMKRWEKDMLFKEALQLSCVPCYQRVAREIGVKRMKHYIDTLDYGNMDVDSTNIDMFWLQGDSKISQFEQIDFLRRLYYNELPISNRTSVIIKRMLLIDDEQGYELYGKTGWSITDTIDNGWFVGFIVVNDKPYFFATNFTPMEDYDVDNLVKDRAKLTMEGLRILGVIE